MELLFGGRLPRDAAVLENGSPASAEERLERTAARITKQRQAEEKAQREREQQAELARLRGQSADAQASLATEEQSLRSQEGVLQRELPGQAAATPATLAEKLHTGIAKTREQFLSGLSRIVSGRTTVDKTLLEDLEELLLTADVGVQTTDRLIKALRGRLGRNELQDPSRLKSALHEEVRAVLNQPPAPPNLEGKPPVVILFAGVNGSGKTTTIGKLGAQYQNEGRRVLLVAGDTFRAAAVEQLAGWAGRAGCDVFSKEAGANPSGVVYQAVEKARDEGYGMVLCDTAGRLHTKSNLMEELKKIKRVITKLIPDAPHETYLVLDANNGQNAIYQTRDFHEAVGITGLIVTKLDGTARGGVVVGIVNEFELPVRYIGVGEGVDDLRPFDAGAFADSLFD